MAKQKLTKEERAREEALASMLLALARAYQDPLRPHVRVHGLEERDLAFEADLLAPMEVELSFYATQKRGRVLRLLREMAQRGWVELDPTPPIGAYKVRLTSQGSELVARIRSSDWGVRWERLRARMHRLYHACIGLTLSVFRRKL